MSRSGMISIHPRAARISCRGPLLPPREDTARRLIHSGDAMHRVGAHIGLSPSDLNDYVECPHLTTLALEVARGTRRRPHVPEGHADLLSRKGEEHEATYLKELRTQGRQVAEVVGTDR